MLGDIGWNLRKHSNGIKIFSQAYRKKKKMSLPFSPFLFIFIFKNRIVIVTPELFLV